MPELFCSLGSLFVFSHPVWALLPKLLEYAVDKQVLVNSCQPCHEMLLTCYLPLMDCLQSSACLRRSLTELSSSESGLSKSKREARKHKKVCTPASSIRSYHVVSPVSCP